MKKIVGALVAGALSLGTAVWGGEWIRVNQLGYLPASPKVAVYMSDEAIDLESYALVDDCTGQEVMRFDTPRAAGLWGRMQRMYRLDFSACNRPGTYRLRAGDALSPRFVIGNRVYDGTADFILRYMRQQRCGFNPFERDSCHTHDGYIVYYPTRNGQHIDVRGGWHDASDQLQYVTTSANATYQMMFAYLKNPGAYGDAYDANGLPGANGIPDIVDEIKWGLDWLNRMNPSKGEMYNQIADDRDHKGFRLPSQDEIDYGWGKGLGRPVYYCSGEPQVRGEFTNATTGVASTAGKYASCFALGAQVLADFYPTMADTLLAKARDAYRHGVEHPGVCQTASVVSPYIYEECNWTDDMELAAAQLYLSTGEPQFLNEAVEYGRFEPVTPWMGADSARHYQWYPFINLGHYHLAGVDDSRVSREFTRNLRSGLERVLERAEGNPFLNGVPAIWCSNNLTVAVATQCRLYRELTGDDRYREMEAALTDWLFGCNPWGTSMITELPLWGDYPIDPHTPLIALGAGTTVGGLVDGPVYASIFNNLRGVRLSREDPYAPFQSAGIVYHDDMQDYSTNEPTMDGTASLSYLLSSLQQEGAEAAGPDRNEYACGGIVRTDRSKRQISLVFTAADKNDGARRILETLQQCGVKGSFFFTGEFYERFPQTIEQLIKAGHYVGAHSDGHLLYCAWERRDSTLVDRQQFESDMQAIYGRMSRAGIDPSQTRIFVPPYEYYNETIAAWARGMGLRIVNFTPGTWTNADYTTPDMTNYRSSRAIYNRVMEVEKREGLNGHILLFHLGTDERRTDKFYDRYLERLIRTLQKRGYTFVALPEAVGE